MESIPPTIIKNPIAIIMLLDDIDRLLRCASSGSGGYTGLLQSLETDDLFLGTIRYFIRTGSLCSIGKRLMREGGLIHSSIEFLVNWGISGDLCMSKYDDL